LLLSTMHAKDRTSEFNSLTDSIKQRKVISPKVQRTKVTERTQFSLIASQIGRDIKDTADKLEALQKLAKNKSIFYDPALEIQDLTSVVNQNIKNINGQIASLQEQKSFNGKKSKHAETHSETVLETLKSKMKIATKTFTQVLETRTENLKSQQKERENFMGSQSSNFGKRTAESPLYKPTSSFMSEGDGSEVAIAMPQTALLTQERYINSRLDAVTMIERTITELQGIFQQLAPLVVEQGEMIQRIDENVDNTAVNIDNAQTQLLSYLSSVSNNRWLVAKIFLVLFVFIIIFVVFFV